MTDQERRDDALSEIIFNEYTLTAFSDSVQIECNGMQCLGLNWAIAEFTTVITFVQTLVASEPRFSDDISTKIGTLHICYSNGQLTFVRTLSCLPAMCIPICDWEQMLPLMYWLHNQYAEPCKPTTTEGE